MIKIILKKEFDKVEGSNIEKFEKLNLLSDMCRLNTLSSVKKAGSGHLGSSFSAMDIVTYLYYEKMNIREVGLNSVDRDIYFSSKGHDVPGLYSLFYALGILPLEKLLLLRRLDGLDGHPEKHIPGIEANSGSLGMGISKGRGMAWAKKYQNNKGHIYVLTGDGELQEGQIYESLQTTISQGIKNLTVIIDHNKYQTDEKLDNIVSLGNLKEKLESFGWLVYKFNGHSFSEIEKAFSISEKNTELPKILIADTIKGKGISFMQPNNNEKYYDWHSGAPDDDSFKLGMKELITKINKKTISLGISNITLTNIKNETINNPKKISSEYVADGYGEALSNLAKKNENIIVLDGDLSADCRIRNFEKNLPHRFIENGIAEQDMVSMAGGLASQGLLPVVNSFASFLASRPNEQIYNNAAEKTKIIYACHFAGIIPAGPGKSHQSIRDISLLSTLPNVTIFQPSSADEAKQALQYFVEDEIGVCVLRMNIGPSPKIINQPDNYQLCKGKGFVINGNEGFPIIAYGPVMLNEALIASSILLNSGIKSKVINMPWLNCVDKDWLIHEINNFERLYVIDDHSIIGGLGDHIISSLNNFDFKITKFGLKEFPYCGNPVEVLRAHKLDGESIAKKIAIDLDATIEISSNYENAVYLDNAPQ